VGDEVVGIGAGEDEHSGRVVDLGLLDEGDQVAAKFGAQEVHGRGSDVHEEDRPLPARDEGARLVHRPEPFGVSTRLPIHRNADREGMKKYSPARSTLNVGMSWIRRLTGSWGIVTSPRPPAGRRSDRVRHRGS
jgi:hypothetical protein